MFKLRYPALALVFALFGAVAALGVYMYYVPLPNDAMARGEALGDDRRAWLNRSMSEVFPVRTVAKPVVSQPLPERSGALEGFSFRHAGSDLSIDDLHERQDMLGLVVLKDGAVVHESYGPGAGPGTLFTTWSVVKSLTSTLVGLAVQDGYIGSVDEPLTAYLPELRGTAYDGVTIRQALQMSSGVTFDVDGGSDTVALLTDSAITGKRSAFEIAMDYPRGAEPGTVFNYNTAETQVLLELVRRVTGETASAYMSEKLWQPLGMAYSGAWVLDGPGQEGAEIGGAMFNAALRDWARFGQFIAQDGVWEGKRLLPEGWVEAATVTTEAHVDHGKVHPDEELGYGWQWWTRADGTFQAAGAYGQLIYVDPAGGLVIAKASAWPEARVGAYAEEVTAMARALAVWDFGDAGVDPAADIVDPGSQSPVAETAAAAPVTQLPAQQVAVPRQVEEPVPAEVEPASAAVDQTPSAPPSIKPEDTELTSASEPDGAPVEGQPEPEVAIAEAAPDPEDGMGVAESRFILPGEDQDSP
ncbi:MAG: serine hydrolase [Pseudomonadota bacterium]